MPAPHQPEYTPKAVTVSAITEVAGADDKAIDAQLDALARRTTVDDLARAGKTNLKTLSERQLKEWIREALRRVISTTTSVSEAEQERMLAAARTELGDLMREGGDQAEALETQLKQAAADRATLARERDALLLRTADLERSLETAAGQIADAEAAAHDDGADIEDVESLRSDLAQAYARLSASEHERANLQKTLGARLVATSEIAAALLELDNGWYGGANLERAQADAAGDEAAFYADEVAARATAEALGRDLAALRAELAAKVPDEIEQGYAADRRRLDRLADRAAIERELAAARARPAEDPETSRRLAEAEAAIVRLQRERDEARHLAEAGKKALARVIAQADPAAAQNATTRIARAEQGLREATERVGLLELQLAQADGRAADAEARLAAAEQTRARTEAARQQALAAATEAAARRDAEAADLARVRSELAGAQAAQRTAAARSDSLAAEIAKLGNELIAARDQARHTTALAAEREQQASQARAAATEAREAISALNARVLATEAARRQIETELAESRRAAAEEAARAVDAWPTEAIPERLSHDDDGWRWTWSAGGSLRLASHRGAWQAGEVVVAEDAVHGVALAGWTSWVDRLGRSRLAGPALAAGLPEDLRGPPTLARGTGSTGPFAAAVTGDGRILLIEGGGAVTDLTTLLGCPPAEGGVAAWWWAAEDSRHLAYRTAQGAVHELMDVDGTWSQAALSSQTNCPPAAGDPVGYAPGDNQQIIFRSRHGHIHNLCFDAGRWLSHDLTYLAEAPPTVSEPAGCLVRDQHHVAYRCKDGGLHILRLRGDWRHLALPRLGTATGAVLLATSGGEGALAWESAAGWQWARFAEEPDLASPEPLPG